MAYDKSDADIQTRLWNVAGAARGRIKDFMGDGSLNLFAYVAYRALDRGLNSEGLTSGNLLDAIDSTPVSAEHRATLRSLVSNDTVDVFRDLMRGFSDKELRDIVLRWEIEPLTRYSFDRPKDPRPAPLTSEAGRGPAAHRE